MILEARKGEPAVLDLRPHGKCQGNEVDTCLTILRRGKEIHEPRPIWTQRSSVSKEGTIGPEQSEFVSDTRKKIGSVS